MNPEARAWRDHVRPALLIGGGSATRVENPLHPGTFDVSYVLAGGAEGWLELKVLRTGWACPHLTREQVLWGRERVRAGGRAHLLVRHRGAAWLGWWVFAPGDVEPGRFDPERRVARFDRLDRHFIDLLRHLT